MSADRRGLPDTVSGSRSATATGAGIEIAAELDGRAGIVTAARLRVAVIADFAEEGWPSMDLVADMLVGHLEREHGNEVDVTLVRPPMPRRLTRLPGLAGHRRALGADRIAARFWDYPRVAGALAARFDVYHLIDHSYSHLVHRLPEDRVLVTCHDIDTFRSVLQPEDEPRSPAFRWMTRRILSGLRRAAQVACDSEATRRALLTVAAFQEDRLTVIPNGTDTGGTPEADAAADVEAARILGPRRGVELLHVGSTIDRKRIDVLLEIFAAIRAVRPEARLIRVGGPFTAEQRVRARALGVLAPTVVVPHVDRATLAAIYRRSAVALLPSEREGFGLPVIEALACGTPVIASDIPVLREVGDDAITYCGVGEIAAWRDAVLALLRERETDPGARRLRSARGLARADAFSWSRYASSVVELYQRIAAGSGAERAAAAL